MKFNRIATSALAASALLTALLASVLLLSGAALPLEDDPPLFAGHSQSAVQSFLHTIEQMLQQTREPLPLRLEDHTHLKYMDGNDWGFFEPSKTLSRAEAAYIFFSLMADPPSGSETFPDAPEDAWYAPAIRSLARAGVMHADNDGSFRPDAPLTRREFAAAAARFLPNAHLLPLTFCDVEASDPDYAAICATIANGIFNRPADGAFRPDDPLTRAEAAATFNHLLGRFPDLDAIAASPQARFFPDVPADHWAYAHIMEASISHELEMHSWGEEWLSLTEERNALPDGFHTINGALYCTQDGRYVRSSAVNGFLFDENGRYTTGNPSLDDELAEIIRTHTDDSMSQNQKLRAVYAYVRDNFTYIKRDLVSKGQTGWEPAYAEAFLQDGRGNCFGYAAAFCLLARELGYDAHTVVGWLGKNRQPHGWVEIALDGQTYLYDTELEMKYRSSNFFQARYGETPFSYHK